MTFWRSLFLFLRNRMELLRAALDYSLRTGTRVVRVPLGPLTTHVVLDPELAVEVLTQTGKTFRKDRFTRSLQQILGNGLLVASPETWRKGRKLVQPAFHQARLAEYVPLFGRHARDWVAGWKTDTVLPISSGFTELTLRIVGESLLGARLGNRIAVIERAVGYWSRHLSNPLVMLRPRVPLWPSPFYRRLAAATAEVEVLLRDLVEEALQKPDSTSFLSALIAHSEKGAVDRKMIRDELLTMLIAGHETTATSMSWMAWLLAVHPEWQKRAREEVQAKGRDPETLADLKSLPVLMAIYLETLRLYPPIWALLRQAVEPVQLGEVSLQPGDHLVVGLAILMRDPRSFASPDEFRPERWLQGGEGKTLAHPAFLAFSAGPRSCIGRDFAVNEVLTVFAVILSRYALHLVDSGPKEMELSFSLRPRGGVQLRVEACSR